MSASNKLERVEINEPTLAGYAERIKALDPHKHHLIVKCVPDDVIGKSFMFEDMRFVITGADIEQDEEPMLYALRADCLAHDESVEDDPRGIGYTTNETAYGDFSSTFMSGTGDGPVTSGRCWSQNIPGIPDGTLIGFYWMTLSAVLPHLYDHE